ncbi:Anoctamin-4 [Desmophyllum pertusum]|uniref:Anoctamin-4 n=1 Tax=Desmophyllum pertusum TaxID=174260 RepID=A0A9W9YGN8_9CNID|nr:Anoctamin-4 [Desmophyllum pertusum]
MAGGRVRMHSGEKIIELSEKSTDENRGVYLSGAEPRRRIDYVLVHETCKRTNTQTRNPQLDAERLKSLRTSFEKQLERRGTTEVLRHYVLIHAPWEVLAERAESTKLKVPLQVNDTVFASWLEYLLGSTIVATIKKKNPFKIRDASIKETPDHFMGHFKRDRLSVYAYQQNCNDESFFSVIDRQHLVQQILNNTRFSEEPNDVGLTKLVYDGAYQACYPLHEGKHDSATDGEFPINKRQELKRDWQDLADVSSTSLMTPSRNTLVMKSAYTSLGLDFTPPCWFHLPSFP